MIPQTLPDFPPRTWPFDVSATVRDAGGGIFVLCACVCVCVCFKVAVWFCSELTRGPEVIKIQCWRRALERVGVVLGWCFEFVVQRWCVLLHSVEVCTRHVGMFCICNNE